MTALADSIGLVETEFFTIENPRPLQSGQKLGSITLAYETYGELNDSKDNAILLFHALTGSQHAAGFNPSVPAADPFWVEETHKGWWDGFIGPNKALDTDRFYVICANYLGGCYGSTGPASIDPAAGQPYGSAFPRISVSDVVDSQMALLDHLGVETLHATIGGSVGGMMCVNLASRYPERVKNVIPIAAGLTVTALQRIHIFEQCNAIENDPHFAGGDYYDGPTPDRGLALARMIGHKAFVSLKAMEERARKEVVDRNETGGYIQIVKPIESYMWHQGTKFVQRFDANSYLRTMELWQTFDLVEQADGSDLESVLRRCRNQRFMVFSIDSDVCYYPEEQHDMVRALKRSGVPVRRVTVHSDKGHDSFLLEPELFAPHLIDTLEWERW